MGNVAELWLRGRPECGESGERCGMRSHLEREFPSCDRGEWVGNSARGGRESQRHHR
jgi:hypothetical protein